jgi:hypothetical protein
MNAFDVFSAELQAFIEPLAGLLPHEDFELVARLIDNHEGGEALILLAGLIVEQDLRVPRSVIERLRDLVDGLIDASELPAGLDAQAIADS